MLWVEKCQKIGGERELVPDFSYTVNNLIMINRPAKGRVRTSENHASQP